jgi:pyridoxine 5-phosphate synthase
VAAGHGLTLANVGAITALPEIVELNIGHAVVSDAVFLGIGGAVRAYRTAMAAGAEQR